MIPPDLVSRFAGDLARAWPLPRGAANKHQPRGGAASTHQPRRGTDDTRRLALAVSGGPDSLALLLLAQAAMPGRIAAATVDHQLRAEAADEAAEVTRVCAALRVPHETLRVTVAPGNVQAEARAARYAAMGAWMAEAGLTALATAHHTDDQAETLLLRLNRGRGVAGLAGVRAFGPFPGGTGRVVRPLLGWRRAELAGVVAASGLKAADDPSNRDDAYDRVRLRAHLAAADWLDVPAIAASAAHLADADAALDWAASREWSECVNAEGLGLTYRPQAPRAVALRVMTRIVAQMDGGEVRGGTLARAFDQLIAGQTTSLGDLVVRPGPGGWSFTRAAPRRN